MTDREHVAVDTQGSNAKHSLQEKEKQNEKQTGSLVQSSPSLHRGNMNIEKISALRHAIRNGHYDVNAYRLAIRILQQEKELFGL